GYLLGRTKRGRLALGLALLLAGYRPSTQLSKLLPQLGDNLQLGQLTSQLRGPLGVAGRSAAEAVIAAQAAKLTESLTRRTDALSGQLKDAGQTGRDAAEGSVSGVRRKARRAAGADEDGAQEKGTRSRRRRDEDEIPASRDEDVELVEEDQYDDDEDVEDAPPARRKVSVASRRRSS